MKILSCGCGECGRESVAIMRHPLAKPLGLGQQEEPEDYAYQEHAFLGSGMKCPNSGKQPEDFYFAMASVFEWAFLATEAVPRQEAA